MHVHIETGPCFSWALNVLSMASCHIRKMRVAHAPGMPGTFSSPSEVGGEENIPGIPGACTIRNFTYLVKGPWSSKNYNWTADGFHCVYNLHAISHRLPSFIIQCSCCMLLSITETVAAKNNIIFPRVHLVYRLCYAMYHRLCRIQSHKKLCWQIHLAYHRLNTRRCYTIPFYVLNILCFSFMNFCWNEVSQIVFHRAANKRVLWPWIPRFLARCGSSAYIPL